MSKDANKTNPDLLTRLVPRIRARRAGQHIQMIANQVISHPIGSRTSAT